MSAINTAGLTSTPTVTNPTPSVITFNPVPPTQAVQAAAQYVAKIPEVSQGGIYEHPMSAEQLHRRNVYLSNTPLMLPPRREHPFFSRHQNYKIYSNGSEKAVTYTIPDLLKHIKGVLGKSIIETPWLAGGSAGSVMTKEKSADADISYYIDKDMHESIINSLREFISQRMDQNLQFKSKAEKDQYIDYHYLYVNHTEEGLLVIGLGDVDLKFISPIRRRLCVASSDGFHIPLDEKMTSARCVDGSTWCNQEGFNTALKNLTNRILVIKDVKNLQDILWRVSLYLSKGYRVIGENGESLSQLANAALDQLLKNYPLNNSKKRKSCQGKFTRFLFSHFGHDQKRKSIFLLNTLYFLHQSTPSINQPEHHRGALQAYTVLLAEAWLDQPTNDPTVMGLVPLVKLILENPSKTKSLLNMAQGLIFTDYALNPNKYTAYNFPFAESQNTPRPCISIKTGTNTESFLTLAHDPVQLSRQFLESWKELEDYYRNKKTEQTLFSQLGQSLELLSQPFTINLRVQTANSLAESFLRAPLSTILTSQYKNTPQSSARIFYDYLQTNMANQIDVRSIQIKKILQKMQFIKSTFEQQNNPTVLVLDGLYAIFQGLNAKTLMNNFGCISTLTNTLRTLEKEQIWSFHAEQHSTFILETLSTFINEYSQNTPSIEFTIAIADLLAAASLNNLIHPQQSTQYAILIVQSLNNAFSSDRKLLSEAILPSDKHFNRIMNFLKLNTKSTEKTKDFSRHLASLLDLLSKEAMQKLQTVLNSHPSKANNDQFDKCIEIILSKTQLPDTFKEIFASNSSNISFDLCLQYASKGLSANHNESLKTAFKYINIILKGKITLTSLECEKTLLLCENILCLLPEMREASLTTLYFLDKKNSDSKNTSQIHQMIFRALLSAVTAHDHSTDQRRKDLNYFSEKLDTLESLKSIPEISLQLAAACTLNLVNNDSKALLKLFSIAHSLELDFSIYTSGLVERNLMSQQDFVETRILLGKIKPQNLSDEFLDHSYKMLVSNRSDSFLIQRINLGRELNDLLKDNQLHTLIQALHNYAKEYPDISNKESLKQIVKALSNFDEVSIKEKMRHTLLFQKLLNRIISSIVPHAVAHKDSSQDHIIHLQELILKAEELKLVEENALGCSMEIISRTMTLAQNPNLLVKTYSFIRSVLSWENLTKEHRTYCKNQIQILVTKSLEAAISITGNLKTSEEAENAAQCLQLATGLPHANNQLANACISLIEYSLKDGSGFALRLAFETVIKALKKEIYFSNEQRIIINDLCNSLRSIHPDQYEQNIPYEFYVRLSFDLLVEKTNTPIEINNRIEARNDLISNLGLHLLVNTSDHLKHQFCNIDIETIRRMQAKDIVEYPEWIALSDFTLDDFKNSSSTVLRTYLSAYLREAPIKAADFFFTNPILKDKMDPQDYLHFAHLFQNQQLTSKINSFLAKANTVLNEQYSMLNSCSFIISPDQTPLSSDQLENSNNYIHTLLQIYNTAFTDLSTVDSNALITLIEALFDTQEIHSLDLELQNVLFNIFSKIQDRVIKSKPSEDSLKAILNSLVRVSKSNEHHSNIIKGSIELILKTYSTHIKSLSTDKLINLFNDLSQLPDTMKGSAYPEIRNQISERAFSCSQQQLKALSETEDENQMFQLIQIMSATSTTENNAIIADTICKVIEFVLIQKNRSSIKKISDLLFLKDFSYDQKQIITLLQLTHELFNPTYKLEKDSCFQNGIAILQKILLINKDPLLESKIQNLLLANMTETLLSKMLPERKQQAIVGYVIILETLHQPQAEIKNTLKEIASYDYTKNLSPLLISFSKVLFSVDISLAKQFAIHPNLKSRMRDGDYNDTQLRMYNWDLDKGMDSKEAFSAWQALKVLNFSDNPYWISNNESFMVAFRDRLLISFKALNVLLNAKPQNSTYIETVVNAIKRVCDHMNGQLTEEWLKVEREHLSKAINTSVTLLRSSSENTKHIAFSCQLFERAEALRVFSKKTAVSAVQDLILNSKVITTDLINQFLKIVLDKSVDDIYEDDIIAFMQRCLETKSDTMYILALNTFGTILDNITLSWDKNCFDLLNTFLISLPTKENSAKRNELSLLFLKLLSEKISKLWKKGTGHAAFISSLIESEILFSDQASAYFNFLPLTAPSFWIKATENISKSSDPQIFSSFPKLFDAKMTYFLSDKMTQQDTLACVLNTLKYVSNLLSQASEEKQRQLYVDFIDQWTCILLFKFSRNLAPTNLPIVQEILNLRINACLKITTPDLIKNILEYVWYNKLWVRPSTLLDILEFISTNPKKTAKECGNIKGEDKLVLKYFSKMIITHDTPRFLSLIEKLLSVDEQEVIAIGQYLLILFFQSKTTEINKHKTQIESSLNLSKDLTTLSNIFSLDRFKAIFLQVFKSIMNSEIQDEFLTFGFISYHYIGSEFYWKWAMPLVKDHFNSLNTNSLTKANMTAYINKLELQLRHLAQICLGCPDSRKEELRNYIFDFFTLIRKRAVYVSFVEFLNVAEKGKIFFESNPEKQKIASDLRTTCEGYSLEALCTHINFPSTSLIITKFSEMMKNIDWTQPKSISHFVDIALLVHSQSLTHLMNDPKSTLFTDFLKLISETLHKEIPPNQTETLHSLLIRCMKHSLKHFSAMEVVRKLFPKTTTLICAEQLKNKTSTIPKHLKSLHTDVFGWQEPTATQVLHSILMLKTDENLTAKLFPGNKMLLFKCATETLQAILKVPALKSEIDRVATNGFIDILKASPHTVKKQCVLLSSLVEVEAILSELYPKISTSLITKFKDLVKTQSPQLLQTWESLPKNLFSPQLAVTITDGKDSKVAAVSTTDAKGKEGNDGKTKRKKKK